MSVPHSSILIKTKTGRSELTDQTDKVVSDLISEIVMTPADGGDAEMAYLEFDLDLAEIVRIEAEYLGNSEPLGFAFDRVFFSPTEVPEPGSIALLGLVGFGTAYRKRRRDVAGAK